MRRADVPDRRMERFTAKHVLIEASHPQPRQLDGDVIEDSRTMDITVEPGALQVRVARGRAVADVVGDPGAADPHHGRRPSCRPTTPAPRCSTTAGLQLVKDAFVRFRYGDGFSHSRALGLQLVLSLIPLGHRLHRAVQHDQADRVATVLREVLLRITPGSTDELVRQTLDKDQSVRVRR